MPEEVTYYAILDLDFHPENDGFPDLDSGDVIGVARRRIIDNRSLVDEELLRRDLTWGFTTTIVEWMHGESPDLVEITPDQANRLIERFRTEWGS